MNEKLKLPAICVLAVVVTLVLALLGYRYLGPEKPLQKQSILPVADLVRLEKSNPSALTDDQRRFLATIPASEKEQLLNKPSFTLPGSQQPRGN